MFYICLAVGLVICFFGIHIRKVLLFLQGVSLGLSAGALVLLQSGLLITLMLSSLQDQRSLSVLLIAAGVGLVLGIVFAIYERLAVVLNGVLWVIAMVAYAVLALGYTLTAPIWVVLAAVLLAYILLAVRYGQVMLVLSFAFTGAALAAFGACGLLYQWGEVTALSLSNEQLLVFTILTLTLTLAGSLVQYQSVKPRRARMVNTKHNSR